MKTSQTQRNAFTLIELLVVIAIIAILASLAIPAITSALIKGQLTQTASNGKQLYTAGLQMANDGVSSGDARLGWPGDLANLASTGGGGSNVTPVTTVTGYITALQTFGYLSAVDAGKILVAPGITAWNGTSLFSAQNNCAFKIYKTTSADSASNLFCATKNFTYGSPLSATTVPYNAKGFVLVKRDGGAIALNPNQATGNNQLLGLLPGRQSVLDNPVETAADILTQQ